jgi:hypothetical protein
MKAGPSSGINAPIMLSVKAKQIVRAEHGRKVHVWGGEFAKVWELVGGDEHCVYYGQGSGLAQSGKGFVIKFLQPVLIRDIKPVGGSAMKTDKNCSPALKKSPRHSDSASSDHRAQIEKQPLKPERVRKINGSFAFIEHRFLRNGFWASLDPKELLMYIFLVLVADRNGLSYYSYDKICTLVGLTLDEYIRAKDTLIDKDLIAFDGRLFQVLTLPDHAPKKEPYSSNNPEMIRKVISRGLRQGHE